MVDHGAVFESECNHEELGFRGSLGQQADESDSVWGDPFAWTNPESCSGLGDSFGEEVFCLSASDRGTNEDGGTCGRALGLGVAGEQKGETRSRFQLRRGVVHLKSAENHYQGTLKL